MQPEQSQNKQSAQDSGGSPAAVSQLPVSAILKLTEAVEKMEALFSDGKLEAISEALASIRSLRDSLNDEAVQALASTMGGTLEVAREVSSEQGKKLVKAASSSGPELAQVLDRLAQMQRDGVFDAVAEAGYTLKAVRDALNDEAVTNVFNALSRGLRSWVEFSELLAGPELYTLVRKLITAEREGVTDALLDVGYAAKSLRDSLNDEAAINLANLVSQALALWKNASPLLQTLENPVLHRAVKALSSDELESKLELAKPRSGISMLSPSDPEVRKGFGVLLEILRALGSEFNAERDEVDRQK